jgi:hypothetical protein
MNHSRKRKLNRRCFMGYAGSSVLAGLSHSPAVALFSTILGGQSQKAWAESLGLKPKTWVQIHEGGGPARYMCDSFLTPYSTSGLELNPMVGTRFKRVGERYIGVEYETRSSHGIQVPLMWTHELPAASGGYRPMTDLLSNLLCIQGVNTQNAGHTASSEWSFLPPGARQSTSAMSADAANAPFPALQIPADGYTFLSTKGKSSLTINGSGNLLSRLLDPFKPGGSTPFRNKQMAIRKAYELLLPEFDELARSGHPGADAISQNRVAALGLLETNFAGIDAEWNALVDKYKRLIGRAIYDPAKPLVGINDLPIGDGGSGNELHYRLSMAATGINLHLSKDLRTAVDARTTVPGLAERFAFTEYVLRNRLSTSVAFGVGQISPFIRESDGAALEGMTNDQHFVGIYPSLYFNLLRFRANYACLCELIDQLKTANMFNDTIISLSGEFNRNPDLTLSGSGHGFTGKSSSFFSGAFNGPLIVGNLRNDNFLGWGAGGIIPELGRQLNLVDTAVTIAHLIGVPPPFTSALPVVTLSSNGLISNVGRTRHV